MQVNGARASIPIFTDGETETQSLFGSFLKQFPLLFPCTHWRKVLVWWPSDHPLLLHKTNQTKGYIGFSLQVTSAGSAWGVGSVALFRRTADLKGFAGWGGGANWRELLVTAFIRGSNVELGSSPHHPSVAYLPCMYPPPPSLPISPPLTPFRGPAFQPQSPPAIPLASQDFLSK